MVLRLPLSTARLFALIVAAMVLLLSPVSIAATHVKPEAGHHLHADTAKLEAHFTSTAVDQHDAADHLHDQPMFTRRIALVTERLLPEWTQLVLFAPVATGPEPAGRPPRA